MKKCLRCNRESDTPFCPYCGHPMNVSRLTIKEFLTQAVTDIYQVSGGFLYTVINLLYQPWKVIREYIHGRRSDYISPVAVLVILIFISSILSSVLGLHTEEVNLFVTDRQSNSLIVKLLNMVLSYINDNRIIQELLFPIPGLLVVMAVYWKQGAKKYNIAEYLTAMLYLNGAASSFELLLLPFKNNEDSKIFWIVLLYIAIICAISSYHAFQGKSHVQRTFKYILFLFLTAIIYFILIFVAIILLPTK